jgi:hypothetical protein
MGGSSLLQCTYGSPATNFTILGTRKSVGCGFGYCLPECRASKTNDRCPLGMDDHSVIDKNWFCLRISQHLWVIGRPLNDAKGSALLLIAIHLRKIGE